jgi:hypothetical protein
MKFPGAASVRLHSSIILIYCSVNCWKHEFGKNTDTSMRYSRKSLVICINIEKIQLPTFVSKLQWPGSSVIVSTDRWVNAKVFIQRKCDSSKLVTSLRYALTVKIVHHVSTNQGSICYVKKFFDTVDIVSFLRFTLLKTYTE